MINFISSYKLLKQIDNEMKMVWTAEIAGLSGILDVLGDYLTAMTGVFSYGGRRPSQNVYLG